MRMKEITEMTSGCVASVAMPMGKTKKRSQGVYEEDSNPFLDDMGRRDEQFAAMAQKFMKDPRAFAKWIAKAKVDKILIGNMAELKKRGIIWAHVQAAFKAGQIYPFVQDELKNMYGVI